MESVQSKINAIELIVSTRDASPDIIGDINFLCEDVMKTHDVNVISEEILDNQIVVILARGNGIVEVKQHLVRVYNDMPDKQDEIIEAVNDIMTNYHSSAYQVTVKSILYNKPTN